MLVICFVFVFAFTLSVSTADPSDTAFALTGTNGVTTQIYGNHGDFGALDMSSAGFPGASSGTSSWSFTEYFSNIVFSLTTNISIAEVKDANYTFSGGTGTFNWNAENSGLASYNDIFAIINYKVPTFIKNILGNSGITVKVTFAATVNRSSGGGSGIFLICSDKSTNPSDMTADIRDQHTTVSNVTLASNVTVLSLGFYGYESAFNKGSNVTVSNISVQFAVSMSNPSDSDSKSIYDGSAPVVAEEYNTVGTANAYVPYLTSAETASTWPVWYESIESTLNKVTDSVTNGAGKLQSYTNTARTVSLTNTSGTAQNLTYYKSSQVEFVDTYDYSFGGAFNKLTKGEISVADFKKIAGLGDKFLSNYSGGTYTWTTGDANYRYAAGIQSVQVGDVDGAVFNLYTANDVGRYKTIKVDGASVGYAVVTKTNRGRVVVKTYMYANAKVTTKVTDYGGQSVSRSITFSGIDTTKPVAPSMAESDFVTGAGTASAINALTWNRTNTYTGEVLQNIDNDATNGQASFSPYIWFYVVDKAEDISTLLAKPARTYASYSVIKTAGLTPIAVNNLATFKYDFASGEATGIGGAKVGNASSIGACVGSGYYRFTFFTVDLAGNLCASTSVCYVKADFEKPTFNMYIEYCSDEEYDEWQTITKAKNGAWATGETIVTLELSDQGSRYVNANGVNLSNNTLVFDAGSETYAIVFDTTKIVSINGASVNATTYTFNENTIGKIQTDASEVSLKITYYPGNGDAPAYFALEFPELKTNSSIQNQVFPNIDWTSVFTLYAGVDYVTDGTVSATDGWNGGVKILVDRNRPQTPTLANDDDFLASALTLFDDDLENYTLANLTSRKWFTTAGLSLDAQLDFKDDLTEIYGDKINVYIGIRTIKQNADFNTFKELTRRISDFADNYRDLKPAKYEEYFNMVTQPSGQLDDGITDLSVNLIAKDNAGLRIIFVWAVDQAGNVSELSQYYVLADANTYTITSTVLENSELAGGSATIVQSNFEGVENERNFKRGDVVTFTINMNTSDMNAIRYAPYTFKKTDNSGESLVLSNYTAAYAWNIEAAYVENVTLDNGAFAINYTVDDFSRVDALDAIPDGSFKRIRFEFAHREVVDYTVTNWQSSYTGVETAITMSVSNDKARSAFVFKYLDYNLNSIPTPIYPNTEEAPNYFVAIFILTDNPNYVIESTNRQVVNEYSNDYYFGYVESASGTYKLENGEYVELGEDEIDSYEGQKYARQLLLYVEDENGDYKKDEQGKYIALTQDEKQTYTGTRYSYNLGNIKLHHGYQKVSFEVYKIGKGSAIIKALDSSTRYGDVVTLGYVLKIADKTYFPFDDYYYYEEPTGTYKRLDNGNFVSISTEEIATFTGTRYARTQYDLTGVQLELYTTASAPYTDCSIGSYTIIQTGDVSLEYFTVGYESAIHTINTRPISIVVLAGSKVYGSADPDFRFSVNLSEFGSESALTAFFAAFGEYTKDGSVYTYYSNGAVRRASGENAGQYIYTANNSAFDIDTNYSLNIDLTTNVFSITKKTVLLTANGQSVVKLASDNFDPANDWADIHPTYTLLNEDLQFASEILGSLALNGTPVSLGGDSNYEYRYQYDVTLGTIVDTNNLHFVLDNPSNFFVYVTYADATVIKLRADKAFAFVFGTDWSSSLVDYSYEMFEGLEEGCYVSWTATLTGAATTPNAGSYLVTFDNVNAIDAHGDPISRVVVEAFNVTFEPAVVVVAPTYTSLKKGYGDPESAFGIGFEIVSIGGKKVGTGEGEISEYAGYSVSDILGNITGAFARGLYSGNNMLALGTRYDNAADENGVLFGDDALHYAFALSTKFAVANANFIVDSTLSAETQALRFEIEKHEIHVSRTAFVGVDKVIDNTSAVNYRDTQVADVRGELVLSTDDVQIDYVAHYADPTTLEEKSDTGKAKIVFDWLGLKGEQACNYLLVLDPADLQDGKIVIEFHDNVNNLTSIRITTGSIAIANKDYVTISKQYDGTNAISASDVKIAEYTDDAGVGTKILCNLLGSARVISGTFGGSGVNSNYVLSIELFFPIGTNKDDLNKFKIEAEENATDVVIETTENAYSGYYGIIVKINNQKAAITQRVINAKSFMAGSLAPVTRDYNGLDTVDVQGEFNDTALASGDDVKLSLVGVVNDANYGVDGRKTGTFAIRFDSYEINNLNYVVDIDNLNSTYTGDKALKATINRAKLIPNFAFNDKQYDGTVNVDANDLYSSTGFYVTTVNYATELASELATFTLDGTPTFALSNKGQVNGNVTIEDGKVVLHDVLVSGLKVLGETNKLKNYEIYGFRYANGSYVAVGAVPTDVVENYEILKVVAVEKRQVVIDENHINVHDKIYDGTKDAGASIRIDDETNIVHADQEKLVLTATGEFAQKQVGEKIEVKISDISLGVKNEADKYLIDNYKIGSYSGAIIEKSIFERPITFTTTLGTKVYSADMAISNNVIRYTFEGFLGNDATTYGVQTRGGAYYFDKNVSENLFIEDENGTYKLDENGNYVTISADEIATYEGARYKVNFDKQGTVYNPTLMNTKAHYMNYRLTQAVSKADYTDGEYYACELLSGEIYRAGDPRIVDANVKTYYFDLKTTQRYFEVAKTNKYIFASNEALVEAARTAGMIVKEGGEEKTYHVGGQLAYLIDKNYTGGVSGTLDKPVAYKDATYDAAEAQNAIVGFYVYEGKDVYFVTDELSGTYQTATSPMTYSNDAYGRIRKKVAVISDVTRLNEDVFTKQYDGTTKFYGVAGVDYSYNESNIGIEGDDLYIVGVVAKFEKSSVGTVYVSFEAEALGGADAGNYSYGTIRSARQEGHITKRTIDAKLNDGLISNGDISTLDGGAMEYGTNYISGVEGFVEYTIDGKALTAFDGGLYVKLADFIEVVGLDESLDATYIAELTKSTYNKLADGGFEKAEGSSGEYIALDGNVNLPTAKPKFSVTRPSAGSESISYRLYDGEASNFEFNFAYTGTDSSILQVRQKDLYVVADLKDYNKDYAGEDPAITINYVDLEGNSAFAPGETWQSAFGKRGEYLPTVEFWLYDLAGNPVERISATSKVNDGNDTSFVGNYVLVIKLAENFDKANSNYDVHCGTVQLVNLDAAKNARYQYVFDDAPEFKPNAPELTINLPTVSGVYVAATKESGYAITTTYNRTDQTGIALTGVKAGDVVYILDKDGRELHAEHAGVYQGTVVLRRNFKANDQDTNGYSAIWRSDVNADVKVNNVKITVEKASPMVYAKAGSIEYDGFEHFYNTYNIVIGAPDLDQGPDYYTLEYKKKVGGDLVDVDSMKDAGSYTVYITYDSRNPDYLVETYPIQYSIIPATVTVRVTGDGRFFYTEDGFDIDFAIEKLKPTNVPITKSDMFVQILLGGKSLFKVNEYNRIVPIGNTVSVDALGNFVFAKSGKYAIQIVLKDATQEGNYNIVNGAATIELVVNELDFVPDNEVKASVKVVDAENIETALLADKFEVRYVYDKNESAEDDLYFAKLNSNYYLSSIESAVGTSASVFAVVRMQLTCNGANVKLNGTQTRVSVELSKDILDKLDNIIIYKTVTQSDSTVKLQKLTDYEIKDGVLTYETDELGSIVFVRVGRDVPMLAIVIPVTVVGVVAIIVAATLTYIVIKRKKLKKMMLN